MDTNYLLVKEPVFISTKSRSVIRITIADDHRIHLEGMKALLSSVKEVDVIDTATNGLELISLLENNVPDILLLDLNMPKKDGFWAIKQAKQRWPRIKIIVMSSYQDNAMIQQAKETGADGYIFKTSDKKKLQLAIKAVYRGRKYFPCEGENDLSSLKIDLGAKPIYNDDFLKKYSLTNREAEVLILMANSLSSDEIARKLFLSPFTVSTHRKKIKAKLKLNNIADVIRFAFENDLF
jgi:DNA-binding NarL/FixJ family response regulator